MFIHKLLEHSAFLEIDILLSKNVIYRDLFIVHPILVLHFVREHPILMYVKCITVLSIAYHTYTNRPSSSKQKKRKTVNGLVFVPQLSSQLHIVFSHIETRRGC